MTAAPSIPPGRKGPGFFLKHWPNWPHQPWCDKSKDHLASLSAPLANRQSISQRRLPRPSDWGIGMTVCIGAVNVSGEIVTASDSMLTMSHGAFCNNWLVMYAAEDVGVVPRLLRRIRDRVIGAEDDPSVDRMIEILRDAFQAERRERAAELYLSSFGIDLPQFLTNGSTSLGENLAAIVLERLERHQLGCELLVVGRDMQIRDDPTAHLLHVSDPGVVKDMSVPGYWAIGTGGYIALSSLVSRKQNVRRSLAITVYNVCEAKFAAEVASGVGKRTFVTIHKPNGAWTALGAKELHHIRNAWEATGRPRPATAAHLYLADWLNQADWNSTERSGGVSASAGLSAQRLTEGTGEASTGLVGESTRHPG